MKISYIENYHVICHLNWETYDSEGATIYGYAGISIIQEYRRQITSYIHFSGAFSKIYLLLFIFRK